MDTMPEVQQVTTMAAQWLLVHEHIRQVAWEMKHVDAGTDYTLTMDSSGGVAVHDDERFAGGCYYYGPTSGWVVIIPHHPTVSCASLAACVDAITACDTPPEMFD